MNSGKSADRVGLQRRLSLIDAMLIIASAVLVGLIIFKLMRKENLPSDWMKILHVPIISMEMNSLILDQELSGHDESLVLILELSNCPSCISRGINEVREARKIGKHAIILVSHPWIEEWASWTQNYKSDPVFMVKKDDLSSLVSFPYLPIMLNMKKGQIVSYRLITP